MWHAERSMCILIFFNNCRPFVILMGSCVLARNYTYCKSFFFASKITFLAWCQLCFARKSPHLRWQAWDYQNAMSLIILNWFGIICSGELHFDLVCLGCCIKVPEIPMICSRRLFYSKLVNHVIHFNITFIKILKRSLIRSRTNILLLIFT